MDPWKDLAIPVLEPPKEEKKPESVEVNVSVEPTRYKGEPIVLFEAQALNALSDKAADISLFNAVHVDVIATGTTPSATISLEGSSAAGGIYIALPDPNSSKAAVTANTSFDVLVGSAFIKARVANISGTFAVGQGFTVVITPFIAATGAAVQLAAGTALAGKVGIDQTTANANEVVVKSITAGATTIGATQDAGPSVTGTADFTTSADMSTAADIGPAPTAGQKSILLQAVVSAAVAMEFTFQMETTAGEERVSIFLPANGTYTFIPRYPIKLGTADKKWQGKASVAGNVRIHTTTKSEA